MALMLPLAAKANARPVASWGKIPISFEPNLGQTDSRVKFLSHGPAYTLFLTPSEAVLALRKGDRQADTRKKPERRGIKGVPIETQVLRLKLIGANPHPKIEGVDQLAGTSNYFIGNDPKAWRTSIPTYARVRYRNVWPGVDLVFYGTDARQLEYDLILAPGADPKAIALRFDGAKKLALDRDGDVRVQLQDGRELIHRAPVIYQERNGKREKITGRCVLRRKDTIGFEVAAYDHGSAVYIDPGLVYSTYLGGSGNGNFGDAGLAIAVDSAGFAYVTGRACSGNFPITAGAVQTFLGTNFCNAFITKLNSTGTGLIYSTYLGGSDGYGDAGFAIAVDSVGDAYVTGRTVSANFPVSPGAYQTVLRTEITIDGGNAFVTKLSASGSTLIYSTYLGGSGSGDFGDVGDSIAVDSAGFAYITGFTASLNFPTTPGAFQVFNRATAGSNQTAFVTKLNSDGSALVYSTYLGGSGTEAGWGIAVDFTGVAYVTGETLSTDFPTTPGAFQIVNNAASAKGSNAFVTNINSDGSGLIYSTYLGGSGGDGGIGIAVDSLGSVYVTGGTHSSNFPTTHGAFQTANHNRKEGNAFVTKLDASGTELIYSTYLGGNGGDRGNSIVVNSAGFAYLTGFTSSTDFPITHGAFQTVTPGALSAFVTKLNAGGTGLAYSTYLGGNKADGYGSSGAGIAIDSAGFAYITGQTGSTNFPVTPGAFQTTNNSVGDSLGVNVFVTKLDLLQPSQTLKVSPTKHNFGSVAANATSKPFKVTISNRNDNSELPVFIEMIDGAANFPFSTTCPSPPNELDFKASCAVMIACTGPASGQTITGTLTITANVISPPKAVTLTCKGK